MNNDLNNHMDLQAQSRQNLQFHKEVQEKYNKIREKRLDNDLFPAADIHEDWFAQAKKNLQFVSLLTAQLPIEDFEKLIHCNNPKKLTLNEVGALCNVFQYVSAEQMGILLTQFCKLLRLNAKTALRWNEIVKNIDDELGQQIEQEVVAYHQSQNTLPNSAQLMHAVGEA